MYDGRKRVAALLATLCAAVLTGSVLVGGPSSAEPSLDDVRARVDRLYHEAEQAAERSHDARLELRAAQARLRALTTDLRSQESTVAAVRDEVAAGVVAQFQGQALSSSAEVLLSNDPDAFLSGLATVAQYNSQQSDRVADLLLQVRQLELRRQSAEREVATITRAEEQLAAEQAVVDEKAAEAEDLLEEMEAEERERALAASRSGVRLPTTSAPASGRAGAAVQYAQAQVGDAYAYGAAGPSAFDCSGLTMAAWGAAGVGLPHSSSAQQGYGSRVASSDLQPGDLVFYYSPVSHVGIYIGNGLIVHAANPGRGVRVDGVFSMPYSGAVRPG